MSIKVSIQGQQGSFHDEATKQFFGRNIEIVPAETFADTFQALANGRADHAIVAIENSLFGSINEVYDLLLKHKFWISGEVYSRIEQCLIGLAGTQHELINEVYSHPVALAQCDHYLETQLPHAKRFEHHDTAGSVADIKAWNDPSKVAIASQTAAKLYGLEVLAKDIETNKVNYTRFVVLEKVRPYTSRSNKTSLILTTTDKPGALYHALGAFAKSGINLTKLQSRPIIGRAWHYVFYVDVAGNPNEEPLLSAFKELERQDCEVTLLGSYIAGKS